MRRAGVALAAVTVIAIQAWAGEGGSRPTAEEGFKAIQEVAKGKDADMLEAVIPSTLQDRRMKVEEIRAWREGFARKLAEATPIRSREDGEEAIARFSSGKGDEWELFLHFTGTRWVVGSAGAYQVKGSSLDAARGSSPAKVTLVARTEKDKDYAKSAFSFAHVTGDPEKCKNRMNLWFDGNCGKLHACGKAAVVTATSLAGLDGIPTGVTWADMVAPEKGKVFVVHCRREWSVDFFVACRCTAASADRVELEWTLLAGGPGSPTTIHREQPLKSNDGSDGCDGMCGKSGSSGGSGGSGGGK